MSSRGGVPTPCTSGRPPCDVWHRTFHQDVSHPEFCSADIPPGCLTSRILLRRHSTRMSHIRNSNATDIPPECLTSRILLSSTFHPDVSHPEFCSVDIPLGCLTSEILLRRHSTQMSHIRNSAAADIPFGCLTSRILTPDGRGWHFNFPNQTYPKPLIALTRRVLQPILHSVAVFS